MSQALQVEIERLKRRVRVLESGGGGAIDAADVDFTPAGTIAATDVQAALVEVASEAASALATATADKPATTQSGTTYTVDADDNGATVILSNAGLVTVTIPTGLAVGSRFLLIAAGALGVTLTTTGNTLIGSSPNDTIAQNEGIYVEVTATDTLALIGGTS